jgi:hypothetical protein
MAWGLMLEEFMPGKSIIISTNNAKYSGILPRVDMPHFQYVIKSLDFYSTCGCALNNISLTILPLDSADCNVGPHFF